MTRPPVPAPTYRSPTRRPGGQGEAVHLSPVVAGAWRMADWQMTPADREAWIEQCLDLGITSFDHADIYGDYRVEGLFGEALARSPSLRDRMQLVGKCGIRLRSPQRPEHRIKSYDTSDAHVIAAVENSLRALHTDHLDLLLIHRPDALMDPDALARTFESLRAAGKVLHFGVSNHAPAQLALLHARFPLATHQIELSAMQTGALDDGTLDQSLALGMRPMAWSPLAGGRLFSATDPQARRVLAALQAQGDGRGVSASTMAYAWLLRHPSRPRPITGSGRVEGLQDAVAALSIQISAEEWYQVLEASRGHEVA